MNDLTPINGKPPQKTTTPDLSPGLRQLLGSGLSADEAIQGATDCPALIEEAKAVLPALHRKVEAAGDATVVAVIGRRFETFPQSKRTDGQWAAWWADYQDALSDQPAAAIEAGMREWVRTDTTGFLPKPGQLLALVRKAAEPDWLAVSRANRIAKLVPDTREWIEPDDRKTFIAETLAGLRPASAFSESTDRSSINVPNQENDASSPIKQQCETPTNG